MSLLIAAIGAAVVALGSLLLQASVLGVASALLVCAIGGAALWPGYHALARGSGAERLGTVAGALVTLACALALGATVLFALGQSLELAQLLLRFAPLVQSVGAAAGGLVILRAARRVGPVATIAGSLGALAGTLMVGLVVTSSVGSGAPPAILTGAAWMSHTAAFAGLAAALVGAWRRERVLAQPAVGH